jgi:hypothetical protein
MTHEGTLNTKERKTHGKLGGQSQKLKGSYMELK